MAESNEGEHTLPPSLSPATLAHALIPQPEEERRHIKEYVEIEADGETVTHAEKVRTERVFDRDYQVWDVWTDQDRYWVITNLTNLYSQKDFPSQDYILSFHIGLMARMMARDARQAPEHQRERFSVPWRKWEQAADAFNDAVEAEDYQAIGVRCREALIAAAVSLAESDVIPQTDAKPKRSDYLGWSELIADLVAPGESSRDIRFYLKHVAKSAWQISNWLTHSSSVTRLDVHFALDATRSAIDGFGLAILRKEAKTPDKCPSCGSYRIYLDYRPDRFGDDEPYVNLCQRCGWEDR